jgi:2-(1,2-epoxy-1,2-dihydrophenyl)acetyl-CoA isomerase
MSSTGPTGSYEQIRWTPVSEHVVRVSLDRPRQRNAYTGRMCAELLDALDRYHADDALRAMVLTGEGGAFCSGGDIGGQVEEFAGLHDVQMGMTRELKVDSHAVVRALVEIDKPVIAAIEGAAVAGGLAFALACDYRIAANGAAIGDTSGRAGLLPDEGGAWLFPRAMGYDRAFKMVALAEVYDAATALRLGLVSEVVEAGQAVARAEQLAAEIATRAPLAVRVATSMMRRSLDATLEQAQAQAGLAVNFINGSADAQEGMRAFREKRPPKFTGR